jgi:hypothetical protein
MPDGSQQQPEDPAAQRAREQMREWKEKHQDPNAGGGWFGNVISTVDQLVAAAEAGQFAVNPDTGAAIIKQLTDVQDKIIEMRRTGAFVSTGALRLGGGYATDIATFNKQVTGDEVGKMLQEFSDEVEKLKTAVSKSIGGYVNADGTSKQQVDTAGDGL